MTTFAYSKKENAIAIDGRMTRGSMVASDKDNKYIETASGIYFTIGCLSAANRLVKHIEDGDEEVEVENSWDCHIIEACDPPKEYYVNEFGFIECDEITEDFLTSGSGESYAMAALDMGKNVRQAVQYAMTRDIYSGGKITVYDITRQKFRTK